MDERSMGRWDGVTGGGVTHESHVRRCCWLWVTGRLAPPFAAISLSNAERQADCSCGPKIVSWFLSLLPLHMNLGHKYLCSETIHTFSSERMSFN